MSLAALIRSMAEAGAPAEAIALAVEAIEQREMDAARPRLLARERKRRQRERDSHAGVTGESRDMDGTEGDTPLDKKGPQTPKELNPPTPINDADASSIPPAGVEPGNGKPELANGKRRKRSVGSRLKADWQPPAIDALPLEVQALVAKWPAGAYELVALQFRNHWLSEGRAIGAKRDWPRTWHNWLMREHGNILRAVKQGVDFSAAHRTPVTPAEAEGLRAATAAVVALQQCEPGCAKLIREVLRTECGAQTYDSWLRPTLMGMDADALVVSASSQFMLDWVSTNYGDRIRCLAAEAEKRPVEIRWRVMRPPAKKAA